MNKNVCSDVPLLIYWGHKGKRAARFAHFEYLRGPVCRVFVGGRKQLSIINTSLIKDNRLPCENWFIYLFFLLQVTHPALIITHPVPYTEQDIYFTLEAWKIIFPSSNAATLAPKINLHIQWLISNKQSWKCVAHIHIIAVKCNLYFYRITFIINVSPSSESVYS